MPKREEKLKEIGKGDCQECTWEELLKIAPDSGLAQYAIITQKNIPVQLKSK